MKKLFALAALLLPVALAGCSHPQPYYYAPPPPAYTQIAQQGYHDGIEAARYDVNEGRRPDPNRHPLYRKPPVPGPARDDYRRAFNNGYEQVFIHGAPPR